jgi:hypothetical protein
MTFAVKRISSHCGNMAGVGDFVLGNLPNLIRQQRNDGNGMSRQRHEFHRATLAAFVNQHDRADVVPGQAMLRQVGRQHHAVEFFNHIIQPTDRLWLM